MKKKIIKIAIISLIVGILGIFLLIGSTYFGLFGKLPNYTELKNIKNDEASKIYTADGVLIGKFFLQNRTNMAYKKISPDILNALVATEDSRFYEHNGVDIKSLLRVIVKSMILRDKSAGGGSTLSQQLAKNLYGREQHSLFSMPINKCKEMITASRLEKIYSKEEIITLYLNTVPFGENVYGIESAAQRFFGKSAAEVSTIEAATLIGMLKAATTYNPRLHPERSLKRRNTVLNQMAKYKAITPAVAETLKKKPLVLNYNRLSNNSGLATYLREELRGEVKEIIKEYNKNNNEEINMYRDAIRIYTTIDSKLQQYAEEAVTEHMRSLQKSFYEHWGKKDPWYNDPSIVTAALQRSERYKDLKAANKSKAEILKIFNTKVKMEIYSPEDGDKTALMSPLDSIKHYLKILHTGLIAINPKNGQILAWVGGIDHQYFKYDMVNANRQTGSVFKPIVYAAALENGENPHNYYENKQTTYSEYKDWSPRNASDEYGGYYSMKGALASSVNTVAVELLMKTGFTKTIDLARKMGIEGDLVRFPSLALGVCNSSIYEMAQVFSTFANNGERIKPYYIKKITDKEGRVIYEKKRPERRTVMSADNANIMNNMLEGVINEGTGIRLRSAYGLTNCIAGKTGTTQNNADGWFFGYNPEIVVGIRTGAEDMRVHFRSTYLGQGSNTALPIFGIFMRKALRNPKFYSWNTVQFPEVYPNEAEVRDSTLIKESLQGQLNLDSEDNVRIDTQNEGADGKPTIWKKIKNIFDKQ